MSASDRKKAKRDKRIRYSLAGILSGMAIALFIYAIWHGMHNGLTDKTFLWGIGIIALWFLSGVALGPLGPNLKLPFRKSDGTRLQEKQ